MSWSLISLIVTILVGIPSFIVLRKEALTRLYFIEEDQINFYERLAKDFKEINITYKGTPVNEEFFLLRGFIFCVGRKDITKEHIKKGINIQLDNKSIWHNAKLISTSHDLGVTEEIRNQNELMFELELMKNKDFVYFEAIGEAKDNKYKLGHRIANIPPIKKEGLKSIKSKIELLVLLCMLFVLTASMQFTTFDIKSTKLKDGDLVYSYYTQADEPRSRPRLQSFDSTYERHLDSVINKLYDSAITKYSRFDFLFRKKTKAYNIDANAYIKFEVIKRQNIFGSLIFLLLSVIVLSFIIAQSIGIWKRKNIYKIIYKEIENRKGDNKVKLLTQ